MHHSPLVSIIIPTYNRAWTIGITIQSALNQTYKNTEIIIVDDGSNDNTRNIVMEFGSRISYFFKENAGCSSARNFGINKSKGKYVAFLDSDDFWYENKLEKQVYFLETHKNFSVCITDIEFVDSNYRVLSRSFLKKIIKEDGNIFKYILELPVMTCSYMLVSADILKPSTLFDESFKTANDFDFMLRISKDFSVGVLDTPLVKYKQNSDSVSLKLFSNNRIRALCKFKNLYPDYYIANKKLFLKAESKIHYSYAEDLLVSRYISESLSESLKSLKSKFSFTTVVLLLKTYIILFLPFYSKSRCKDKINEQKS